MMGQRINSAVMKHLIKSLVGSYVENEIIQVSQQFAKTPTQASRDLLPADILVNGRVHLFYLQEHSLDQV